MNNNKSQIRESWDSLIKDFMGKSFVECGLNVSQLAREMNMSRGGIVLVLKRHWGKDYKQNIIKSLWKA